VAESEHAEIARKGSKAIDEWTLKNPGKHLNLKDALLYDANLSGANLNKAYLPGAQLQFANLRGADLSEADLSGANLFQACLFKTKVKKANLQKASFLSVFALDADFSGSRLDDAILEGSVFTGCKFNETSLQRACMWETGMAGVELSKSNLTQANLQYADFTFANLTDADLSNADLIGTKFIGSTLSGAKFSNAVAGNTTFASCDLSKCIGLDSVKHEGPSNIDVNTLTESFTLAGNCFTLEMTKLFQGSGIPLELVETFVRYFSKVKFCSSFICYGNPDIEFASKLKKDLMLRGVPCWLYSLDYTPGHPTWREITHRRREADKMIVLCSIKSLMREGVKKEIEEQIDEDPEKILPVSLDDDWKEREFRVERGQRDLKSFLVERNYADFGDKSKYQESLTRLLKGLKKTP
jgi:uncharacterized protein YjbI with pentapeptide repeats